ncbi:transmembrane protein, putative [Medicago truncatula]|uniref:Transmembrane protein, putative n=1 Tax=Medicago truncatula TaxID=3880 RepID=G7IA16_MEDTR|nr:transmembrane protein, putative [Medicago truncatula]
MSETVDLWGNKRKGKRNRKKEDSDQLLRIFPLVSCFFICDFVSLIIINDGKFRR